ncbi:MAG: mandelate racemase/muconate lactonizing enzyme family protein [Chloroflexi bacterium]|nr:mandelate racemase/muconate lactonizing enzyme family protein [Chloroflexota bacterium]
MRVTKIETIALRDRPAGATSWNTARESRGRSEAAVEGYDETVVRVHTDEGITGIGQAEAPSLVIDAILHNSYGLENLIKGEDPTNVRRLWQKMYSNTGLYGRHGVTLTAIGAVETALWDIAGKAFGKPVHELVWYPFMTTKVPAETRKYVMPYATVYPPGDNIAQLRERLTFAVSQGFHAVKVEEWPGQFGNVDVETDIQVIGAARTVLGPRRDLMIDVQNRWQSVVYALTTIRAVEQFRPFFIEAPLPADNLDGYARLATAVDTRIAAGDWGFTGRHEFRDLIERGHVDVVQPSAVRAGGISEILQIAEMAYLRGTLCIPHAWCHMVGVAAEIHLAAVTPNMPYFEFPIAFPDSPIISQLLEPRIAIRKDGSVEVPNRPGLGFELNEDVVKKFRVDPY